MFTYGFNPGREITHTKKKNGFTDLVSEFVIWWQKPKKVLTGAI